MPAGGSRSIGELLTTLFLTLNFLFVLLLLLSVDTHCKEKTDAYDLLEDGSELQSKYCKDIFSFTIKDYKEDSDPNHMNGRFGVFFIILAGGMYFDQWIRQLIRFFYNKPREYTDRLMVFAVSFVSWFASLISLILINIEAGSIPEDDGEFSMVIGSILLILIFLMNLFILIRTSTLVFMGSSWPDSIGSKGTFGSGSSRVAEQYPVMGGHA